MIRIEQAEAFRIIMSALNQLVDFIAPTYGPAANKVIIDKNLYRMVVDDGVQIARDFELPDDAENAVVKVIRDTAIKTNDRVGDGTTGSLIILRAIMKEIEKQNVRDGRMITHDLQKAAKEAKEQLLKMSRTVRSKEDLERVARISFDNEKIAKLVADLLFRVGKDGAVTMEQSNTMETTSEKSDGLAFNQGYISPYMITDPIRAEAALEKPYILVTGYRLTNANDLLPLMNKLLDAGKRELLIICDNVESDALATLVVNRMQGKFIGVAVQVPQGEGKIQFLKDIALMTGATLFSEETGKRLDEAVPADFGRANRAVIRNNRTTIVGGKGKKVDIEKEKGRIRDLIDSNPRDHDKEDLKLRLARFVNGVAVVKVGAPTEQEQKALRYKVEDSINATKSAMKGGVVAGAGMALAELETSSSILNRALQQPLRQLHDNMGIEALALKKGEAYNVVTGEQGDYFKVGVIDPTEVLVAQIESAVSIATLLVTSHGILVEERPETKENQ